MSLVLRPSRADDGAPVAALVKATGVLDVNSTYAYCAVLEHFSATCVVAELDGALVGFVTGYRMPAEPDTLFVWQVGVAEAARGRGLATRMLLDLLDRAGNRDLTHIHTTIAPDNAASQRLFQALAEKLETGLTVGTGFTGTQLGGGHPDEPLYRIGPFSRSTP